MHLVVHGGAQQDLLHGVGPHEAFHQVVATKHMSPSGERIGSPLPVNPPSLSLAQVFHEFLIC